MKKILKTTVDFRSQLLILDLKEVALGVANTCNLWLQSDHDQCSNVFELDSTLYFRGIYCLLVVYK